jgi:hypothetical protein
MPTNNPFPPLPFSTSSMETCFAWFLFAWLARTHIQASLHLFTRQQHSTIPAIYEKP